MSEYGRDGAAEHATAAFPAYAPHHGDLYESSYAPQPLPPVSPGPPPPHKRGAAWLVGGVLVLLGAGLLGGIVWIAAGTHKAPAKGVYTAPADLCQQVDPGPLADVAGAAGARRGESRPNGGTTRLGCQITLQAAGEKYSTNSVYADAVVHSTVPGAQDTYGRDRAHDVAGGTGRKVADLAGLGEQAYTAVETQDYSMTHSIVYKVEVRASNLVLDVTFSGAGNAAWDTDSLRGKLVDIITHAMDGMKAGR